MNIKDLKCFEAVYEQKSINKAAKQLYITPQGLAATSGPWRMSWARFCLNGQNRA